MSNKEIRMQKKNLLFTVLVIYSLLDRYVSKSRMYKRSLIAAINLLRRIRYYYYQATDRNVEFIEEKFVKWIAQLQ